VVVRAPGLVITADGPLICDQFTTAVPPGYNPLVAPTSVTTEFEHVVWSTLAFTVQFCADNCLLAHRNNAMAMHAFTSNKFLFFVNNPGPVEWKSRLSFIS